MTEKCGTHRNIPSLNNRFLFCSASELANLKEKVERRESGDIPAPGSASLGADKISQLTAEMRTLRRRVNDVQEEAEGLRRAKSELEDRIRGVEGGTRCSSETKQSSSW